MWAWGANASGQVGDGTTANRSTPVQVCAITGIVAIAAGGNHTVALKSDGTVWAWGANSSGQLGDGTEIERPTPVQVNGLTGVQQIAVGGQHTVVLKNDGTVWAWGYNWRGQLGDGTEIDRSTPAQVSGLNGVQAVAAGGYHTVALKNDGTVWAWGSNWDGQLGDGTEIDRSTPTQVSGLTGVSAIVAGWEHTVALKNDGTVWAWGYNVSGQLGDGTTTNRTTAVQVSGLTGVQAITAGVAHTVALKSDGSLRGWGLNTSRQLCDGSTRNRSTPVQMSGLAGLSAIAAGGSHTVARMSDGTVWAWGSNFSGELGNGTVSWRALPVQLVELGGTQAIAAGGSHTVARKSDGTVWTWGHNDSGQLGDGTTASRATPMQVSDLNEVSSIAAGTYHTLARKNDGTVWAWGSNGSGQLGDTTVENRSSPVQVVVDTGGAPLGGVQAIVAGRDHTLALWGSGGVLAWGANYDGQLGEVAFGYYRSVPTPVAGLSSGVQAVAAGGWFSIALKSDGTVWAWGSNDNGQLGDGTTETPRAIPMQVSGLTGATAICAGLFHTVVLKSDGTVWAWGDNLYGQLGDGTTIDRLTPVQVVDAGGSPLTGVQAIVAGGYHTMAVKTDGSLWAWGRNIYGQIGDGTTTDRHHPVEVVFVSPAAPAHAIAAGTDHSAVLKIDGTVWAWGGNFDGQLGIDPGLTPAAVLGAGGSGTLDLGGWLVGTNFNGDGKSDISWRNLATGANSIWFMNGTTRTSYATAPAVTPGPDWEIVGVGDFNQDGKADLLWRNTNPASANFGRNTIWLMNGATRTSYGELQRIADANWKVVGP